MNGNTFDTDGQDEGNGKEYQPEIELGASHKTAVMAIRTVADVPEEIDNIDTACKILRSSWMRFKELKDAFKAEEKRHKERCMALCEAHGIKAIELYDGIKLMHLPVKKDIFNSDKIKEVFEFTPEQLAVLPKNPDWKKKALKQYLKDYGVPDEDIKYFVDTQEVMELIEDKPKVKKELSEFNPAFLK